MTELDKEIIDEAIRRHDKRTISNEARAVYVIEVTREAIAGTWSPVPTPLKLARQAAASTTTSGSLKWKEYMLEGQYDNNDEVKTALKMHALLAEHGLLK